MQQSNTQAREQARVFFERARQAAQGGDFDGAIDAYLEGLRRAPDAVQEGHVELRVVALRRQRGNGVKPTDEEVRRRLAEGGSPLRRKLMEAVSEDPQTAALVIRNWLDRRKGKE